MPSRMDVVKSPCSAVESPAEKPDDGPVLLKVQLTLGGLIIKEGFLLINPGEVGQIRPAGTQRS